MTDRATDRPPGPTTPKAQGIAAEVRRRIVEREWRQGDRIPDEADLATEFGAARATVNKALQLLADEGLLDRRRRAGTRVAPAPIRKATFTIPIIREQVEQAGMAYAHRVVSQRLAPPPAALAVRLGLARDARLIHLVTVHEGDGRPFQYEDRWLNPAAEPELATVDFRQMSANEWLVRNAPYLRADIAFHAANASARDARLLDIAPGRAILVLQRTTWNEAGPITSVRLACHPGFVMTAEA
ncbi:GntR family transcriptional regulator [Amaricoccus sp.]|uniref:GntR family transcriptional regulator n=1 Tax=Amaricoccus sp. TaxID=1872485 RepID=UPI00263A2993|nr:GntR family transcriptional regulator [Amaricoccus sp.]HRO13091.1 GntR family transcriptional regulator [Amaricoccus sp.]